MRGNYDFSKYFFLGINGVQTNDIVIFGAKSNPQDMCEV
jgi:hypothetical protein